jgi:hypothetical protein
MIRMESKKHLLIDFLKKCKDWVYLSEISRKANISMATVIRWIDILTLENKVEVQRKNGMRMVRWKKCIRKGIY